jgi:hypothetical protein
VASMETDKNFEELLRAHEEEYLEERYLRETLAERLSSNSTFSLSSALTTDSFRRDKIPYARQLLDSL